MKKNQIVLVVIAFIVVVGLGGILYYYTSTSRVDVTFAEAETSITIYDDAGTERRTVTTDESFRLSAGEYYYLPQGQRIDRSAVDFTVEKQSVELRVDPPYSKEYLSSLESAARSDVQSSLSAAYPALIDSQYKLQQGTVLAKGEWYGALLIESGGTDRDPGEVYRSLLFKDGEQWRVVVRPQLVARSADYPAIPRDIINQLNDLSL